MTDPLDQLLRAGGSAARAATGDPLERVRRGDRWDVERRAVRQQRRQQLAGLVATTLLVVGVGGGGAGPGEHAHAARGNALTAAPGGGAVPRPDLPNR